MLLQNYIVSGHFGELFCSDLLVPVGMVGVHLSKKKRKSRSRNSKCAVIRFLPKYWWKSYSLGLVVVGANLVCYGTYHDLYFFRITVVFLFFLLFICQWFILAKSFSIFRYRGS
jgi:hypothetical protein